MLNVCYHTYVNHVFLNVCVMYGLTSHVCYICLTYVVHVLSSNICETYVAQLAVYAALLNRIRTGDQTKKDVEILSSELSQRRTFQSYCTFFQWREIETCIILNLYVYWYWYDWMTCEWCKMDYSFHWVDKWRQKYAFSMYKRLVW